MKKEYDDKGNEIYFKKSNGFWRKREFDDKNNIIYCEDSEGVIRDNRPKTELTLKEIADKFGVDVKKLRIKEEKK